MSHGNCLIGAVWLMCTMSTLRFRVLWRGRTVPHFVVRANDGAWWHFHLVRDVLPLPLGYLWFHGRIGKVRPEAFAELRLRTA